MPIGVRCKRHCRPSKVRGRGGDRPRPADEGLCRRDPGCPRAGPRHRRRRVRRLRRPVGMRQDECAPDDRRARGHHLGHRQRRRPGRQRPAAEGARHRDGLPELRALPAHERLRQHGFRPEDARDRQGRDQAPRRSGGPDPRPRRGAVEAAAPSLGRPAAARRDGPRDRARAAGVPDGRASLEPRRQAPRPDARGDRPDPAEPPGDDRLRDARPERGADARRPGLRPAGRRAPAGRPAPGSLRQPGEPVRGRLHRLARHEPRRGGARRARRRFPRRPLRAARAPGDGPSRAAQRCRPPRRARDPPGGHSRRRGRARRSR